MQPPPPSSCNATAPHHVLQGIPGGAAYDDMGTTATDALDVAITHRIVPTFVLIQIL